MFQIHCMFIRLYQASIRNLRYYKFHSQRVHAIVFRIKMNEVTCATNCTFPTVGYVPQLFTTLLSTILAGQYAIEDMSDFPEDCGEQFVENCKKSNDIGILFVDFFFE